APRDSVSFSENPPFLSTTGSDASFLHINPAASTQIESGAANIAGFTGDFDGDIRQGNPGYAGNGTAPDVGADEFNHASTPTPSPTATATVTATATATATETATATTTATATATATETATATATAPATPTPVNTPTPTASPAVCDLT